jgi:hypothetical protein
MSNTVPVPTPGNPSVDPSKLGPEAVIDQLKAMRSHIGEMTPLTAEQRALLKQRLRIQKPPIVDASINVMGVIENVSQAIGQPLEDVRQMQIEAILWDDAAEEARAFLKDLESSNLVRRQRLALIGTQAYQIGTQLAKDPANAVLVSRVEEVKRLKTASRRKKAAPVPQTPDTPAPVPPATPVPAPTTSTQTTPPKA